MLNQQSDLHRRFQALAGPRRRRMVERLARGPAFVSELARPLSMSMPAVLQHLSLLESSGLVHSAKQGRVRVCRIEPAALSLAERGLTARRAEWECRLDRVGEYLQIINQEENNASKWPVGGNHPGVPGAA
jgi:DNA-binding transcriptional ArsR family regulator